MTATRLSALQARGMRGAYRSRRAQGGASLMVALILLVLMTIVGISGMRSVTFQERMAGNTADRSYSFQAAEDALRQAEQFVETNKPTATANCATSGVCQPVVAGTPVWENAGIAWIDATSTSSGDVTIPAQYVIEYLGTGFPCDAADPTSDPSCKRYRITARSNAGAGRSSVMVQSVYATD